MWHGVVVSIRLSVAVSVFHSERKTISISFYCLGLNGFVKNACSITLEMSSNNVLTQIGNLRQVKKICERLFGF